MQSAAAQTGQAVQGQWIVVFNDDVADAPGLAESLVRTHGGTLRFTYESALKGFSASLPDAAVTALQGNSNVAYVEPNRSGGIVATTTQSSPVWGLDRIDQRDLPLSDSYTYEEDGTGVTADVLDTGVRDSHNEFGGRASFIPNGNNGDFVNDGHGSAEDCHGHGTHVSGTIAGVDKLNLHRRSQDNGPPNLLLYMAFLNGDGSTTNSPPTASFTFSCTDLACDFDGSGSSDSDGSISSYDWEFGDGNTGSGVTVSHTYASGGDYTATLTVTDDGGATDSESQTVSVTEGSTGDFTLAVTAYKVRGLQKADLEWSGATSTDVDIYRDGTLIVTTENDGFHTDNIDQRGGGSYTYQVCEAGTSTCSNEATASF